MKRPREVRNSRLQASRNTIPEWVKSMHSNNGYCHGCGNNCYGKLIVFKKINRSLKSTFRNRM